MLAVTVVVVAGCGQNGADLPLQEAPKEPVWVEPGCPKGTDVLAPEGMKRGSVPTDFVPVAVMRCRSEVRDVPGDGQWTVQVTEKAETPAADLVARLRRPSDPRSTGACTADLVLPPYFVLVNAEGKGILPAVPGDACGKPKAEALDALNVLPFKPIAETPVHRTQSQQSKDTGCPDSWKDELGIGSPKPGPAARLWPQPAVTIRVCVYQAAGDVGNLVSTRTIPADRLSALDSAGPGTTSCMLSHTRFAVLHSDGSGNWAVVELDGCHRLLRPDSTLGQLDAAATQALVG